MLQERLRAAGVTDVVLSPNACVAQHAYGCTIMVYPDGIWYRIRSMDDAQKVLEQHLIGGKPVAELMNRRVKAATGCGTGLPATPAARAAN
jgi:(2Fe-2S) ferredoxin